VFHKTAEAAEEARGCDGHGKTTRSALYLTVKVAGGGPSVHACAVFLGAESRDGGTNSTKTVCVCPLTTIPRTANLRRG
jgi:hypothetical protein